MQAKARHKEVYDQKSLQSSTGDLAQNRVWREDCSAFSMLT